MTEFIHQILHHFTGACGEPHTNIFLLLGSVGALKIKQIILIIKEYLK